jgi:hypothetical protein
MLANATLLPIPFNPDASGGAARPCTIRRLLAERMSHSTQAVEPVQHIVAGHAAEAAASCM